MSNATLQQVRKDAFQANVRHLSQQKYSKLIPFTDHLSEAAETGNWDRLGDAEASAKTRKMATPEGGRVWSRRIALAQPYNDAEVTELEDPFQMLADPNSNIVKSLGMTMGRKKDDLVITAALGNALNSVRNNDATNAPSNVALPAGQTVGDGTGAMTFDLVKDAIQVFNEADVDEDLATIGVIGPQQLNELLGEVEVTSSDYAIANALMQNKIAAGWFGINWVLSTRITGASGERDAFLMKQNAIGFHCPQEVITEVEKDPSLSYAWRPYAQFTAGAVRIEDEHVVRMRVADATNP
jgi:hypothetical protein